MSSMLDKLPPELPDQIIDHLYDDHTALGACSLTCKAWLVSAQAHIFHTLDLTRAERFMKLLATSPRIAQYVRELKLDHDDSEPLFVKPILPQIAPKLVNMQDLTVNRVALNAPTCSAFIESFPRLRRLVIYHCVFDTFQDFTSLLLGYPYMGYLTLWGLEWNVAHDRSEPPAGSLCNLHYLSWDFVDSPRSLVDWMLSTHLPMSLYKLEAWGVRPRDIPSLSRFLEAIGPSLEHFDLDISDFEDGPVHYEGEWAFFSTRAFEFNERPLDVFKTFSISASTSLRTLSISDLAVHNRGVGKVDKLSTEMACFPAILSQVTSSRLEEVILGVSCGAVEALKAVELERIDDILARANFDGLRKVEFWLYADGQCVEGRREVKRRMKYTSGRGIVVFGA